MTPAEIREEVLDILSDIAPDEDLSQLDDDVRFREQLELDSMDFLDIVMELRKRHRIQIPEDDYINLASMNSTVAYLEPLMKDIAARERVNEAVSRSSGFRSSVDSTPELSALAPCSLMYDTIIIGAGMSRAGGRDSAGVLRPARVHSRAALHDRRAELVLSAPRPRLRRRPARAHERHAQGHQDRARWPGCLRQLRLRWDDFAIAPQIGSEIAFPGAAAAVRQRCANAARRSRLGVSQAGRQLRPSDARDRRLRRS